MYFFKSSQILQFYTKKFLPSDQYFAHIHWCEIWISEKSGISIYFFHDFHDFPDFHATRQTFVVGIHSLRKYQNNYILY